MELSTESGENLRIAMTVLPRPDVASFADLRSSYFHTTGVAFETESVEVSETDGVNAASTSDGNELAVEVFNSFSDYGPVSCGKRSDRQLTCCNSCCGYSTFCSGVTCCGGRAPAFDISPSIGNP